MIADHANTYSESVPRPFTLNDLRVHNIYEEEPTHTSILTRSAMVLAAVLAIGAFVWLDPLHLHLFTPAEEKTPAPAAVATAQPAQPPVTQEIATPAPPTPVPAAEVPIKPAPAARAPRTPAPVVRSPAVASKAQSGGRPADKMNSTVARAPVEEKTAPPIVMTTPEERTPTPSPAPSASPEEKANPPIVPKPSDDANSAPKPAAASAPTPATE